MGLGCGCCDEDCCLQFLDLGDGIWGAVIETSTRDVAHYRTDTKQLVNEIFASAISLKLTETTTYSSWKPKRAHPADFPMGSSIAGVAPAVGAYWETWALHSPDPVDRRWGCETAGPPRLFAIPSSTGNWGHSSAGRPELRYPSPNFDCVDRTLANRSAFRFAEWRRRTGRNPSAIPGTRLEASIAFGREKLIAHNLCTVCTFREGTKTRDEIYPQTWRCSNCWRTLGRSDRVSAPAASCPCNCRSRRALDSDRRVCKSTGKYEKISQSVFFQAPRGGMFYIAEYRSANPRAPDLAEEPTGSGNVAL